MKQFIVQMKCVVTKEVVCECETEEQARNEPWAFSIDERETGMSDWDVLSVEEDE